MAELAKARSMQPYIILYKTTLQLGVKNLPKVFTRQRPGRESNSVSTMLVRRSTSKPPSHHCAISDSTNIRKRLKIHYFSQPSTSITFAVSSDLYIFIL